MVAYNFQARFADAVERAIRDRPFARPGKAAGTRNRAIRCNSIRACAPEPAASCVTRRALTHSKFSLRRTGWSRSSGSLRPELTVRVQIPRDLTRAEAEKVARVVAALAVKG